MLPNQPEKSSLVFPNIFGFDGAMSRRDMLLAATVASLWGFNFVVIDWGMHGVPPLLFVAIRFAVVSLAALVVPRLLGELVDSAAAPYRLRAERSGIRLRIATMPDLTLRVDRLQVEVVLRSLLGFAFDAVSDSPRQPRRIWVAAWKDGHDRVCLRIEDSGSGLTPDQVLHLFEPIAPPGSGKRQSGLAISRAIVHSHGGRLWAETSNHGVLKCELPIERHTVAPAPVTPNEAAPAVS